MVTQKSLMLAEANTNDILDRFDHAEYHRLTWSHLIDCGECGEEGMLAHSDDPKDYCPTCGSKRSLSVHPYRQIEEYDESFAWG